MRKRDENKGTEEERMIVFEKFGYTIKLSNKDWKNIRKRFDLKRALLVKENDVDYFVVGIPCSLCKKYITKGGWNCSDDCPFMKAFGDYFGNFACGELIDSLFNDTEFQVEQDYIRWHKSVNKKARRQIKRLNQIMDKIEEENNDRKRNSRKT